MIKTTMDRTDFIEAENHHLRTALRAKDADYRALLEAVEWERECLIVMNALWYQEDTEPYMEARASLGAARSEVGRLVGK